MRAFDYCCHSLHTRCVFAILLIRAQRVEPFEHLSVAVLSHPLNVFDLSSILSRQCNPAHSEHLFRELLVVCGFDLVLSSHAYIL